MLLEISHYLADMQEESSTMMVQHYRFWKLVTIKSSFKISPYP